MGISGSGKTTLIKLLLGFYHPASGEIMIGKHNLNRLNIREWRKCCGVVMQDGFIYSNTIAYNIAPGEDPINEQKLVHAAEIANIRDYIEGLPLSYNTKIGSEGNGLSQGQKQRILIGTITSVNNIQENGFYNIIINTPRVTDLNREIIIDGFIYGKAKIFTKETSIGKKILSSFFFTK